MSKLIKYINETMSIVNKYQIKAAEETAESIKNWRRGKMITKHIVSFSGGKDSTAMLLKMIENNMQIDEIIFCDTSVEFPQMYNHIEKVEKYIGRNITKLKAPNDFEYYMLEHIKTKGKSKGEKGYGWPDFRNRWCTYLLKQQVINKYLKQYEGFEIVEYIGIALDEIARAGKKKKGSILKYPLIELGMTEQMALDYCYSKGFYWEGLYEKFDRVSCYLCPLQRISELKIIYNEYPDLWNKMKELDRKAINLYERKFRPDYSIEELEIKFKSKINPLFKIN